jgi:CheY-like chemotaxis protein
MKERVQQQQRLAAVGQLAAGIAHDFNNIMLVISLYAQMIERTTQLPARAGERLQTIRQQAVHATNLIEQILDFSRRSVLERRPLEVLPFLEEFVRLLQRTLPENIDIAFRSECDECVVSADATRLQQVLMNLAVNARDAMPLGGELRITLDVLKVREGGRRPVPEMRAGRWLALAVADTGQGISPQNLPHLFEPFFTTKDPGQGTGLGLAQVYGIVRQHDGYLNVQSELGRGTTFTVYLPVMALAQKLAPAEVSRNGQASGGETILVAEDDAVAREAIQTILENEGYRVLLAADGKEALDTYAAHRDEIDLVLSDMVMPQMGSVELFQTLQEEDPSLKMVVITGYPLEDDGRSLLEQGILSWMSKPFSMEQLVARVRGALDGV